MNAPDRLASLRVNPDWAKLPLFDRKGWRTMKFGDFAESINERVEPADAADEPYVGLDDLDSSDLHIRRWGKGSDVIGTKLRFRKGDIIFGRRRAYQRKLALAEFDGICSAHAMVVRAKPDVVLPEFLPFLMMSDRFMKRAVEISVGSLSPTINWTTLKLEQFDLPPLEQQVRIVQILAQHDDALEKLLNAPKAAWFAADTLRGKHFGDLVNGKTVPIRDAGAWLSGGTPSRSKSEYWGGDFPWVSPKDMKRSLILDAEEHLTDEGRAQCRQVESGALLIVIRGMILAHSFPVGITTRTVAFNQDMKALVPNTDFNAHYLYHWFLWATPAILSKISDSSHGTKRLSMEDLFAMRVPAVSLGIQTDLVIRLDALDQAAHELRQTSERFAAARMSMLYQWFSA